MNLLLFVLQKKQYEMKFIKSHVHQVTIRLFHKEQQPHHVLLSRLNVWFLVRSMPSPQAVSTARAVPTALKPSTIRSVITPSHLQSLLFSGNNFH